MLWTTSKILLAPLSKFPTIFKVDSKLVISCAVIFVKSAAKFQLLAPQAPTKLTKPQTALRIANVLFPLSEPTAKPKLIPSVIPAPSLTPINIPSHAPCLPMYQVATVKTIVTIGAKNLKIPLFDFSYT